jgi:hypothetical protein
MAVCATCGKEIRDDVWTCGFCGAPVAAAPHDGDASAADSAYGDEGYNPYASQAAASSAYGAASYGGVEPGPAGFGGAAEGMTAYGTPMPQAAKPKSGGLSGTTKLILAAAGVAVIAIVAVWFFVLRGGGGDQFVGTWTAVQRGGGTLVVERGDDGLQVTLVGGDKEQIGPLKTDLSGDELEIKLETTGDSAEQKAAVEMVKALFEATIEDFTMVLRVRGADGHLLLTVSGKPKLGGNEKTTQVSEYVKGTAAGQTI